MLAEDKITLEGHKDSVNVLRFSHDSEQLLSGDEAGFIKLWDVQRAGLVQTIDAANFGPVTSLVWIRLPGVQSESDAFVAGFGLGVIALWKAHEQSKGRRHFEFSKVIEAHDGAVDVLAFDQIHYRLASAGAGHPQVWSLDSSSLLDRISPVPTAVNQYSCSGVHFTDLGKSLLVTYLETHSVLKYQVDPWKYKYSKVTQTRIGSSSVDGDALFISNLANGVDLYSLETLQRVRHFEYTPKVNVILPVCLARHAMDWVVIGGDDGKIRIFNRNTGEILAQLDHGSGGLVQTCDVASVMDQDIIAAGASEVGRKSDIVIWYTNKPRTRSQRLQSWLESTTSLSLTHCIKLVFGIFIVSVMVLLLFTIFYYSIYLPFLLPALRGYFNTQDYGSVGHTQESAVSVGHRQEVYSIDIYRNGQLGGEGQRAGRSKGQTYRHLP